MGRLEVWELLLAWAAVAWSSPRPLITTPSSLGSIEEDSICPGSQSIHTTVLRRGCSNN